MTDQSKHLRSDTPDPNAAARTEKLVDILQRLSYVSAFLGMAIAALGNENHWFLVPGLLTVAFVLYAFILRMKCLAVKIWRSFVGKTILLFVNAHVAILAVIVAKIFVSDALHLPPEDFPITASLLALWGIIGLWMGICGFGLIVGGFLWPLTSVVSFAARTVRMLFSSIRIPLARAVSTTAEQTASHSERLGYNLIGALFSGVVLMGGMVGVAALAPPSTVRVFAFAADYENAPDYPGLSDDRIRLHNNGIVSIATCSEWNVSIRVANYVAPTTVPHLPPVPGEKQAARPVNAEPVHAAGFPPPKSFIEQCRAKDSIWTMAHFLTWINRL